MNHVGSAHGVASSSPNDLADECILCSKSSSYYILEIIDEGSFGQVFRCLNLGRNEEVAVKIYTGNLKKTDIQREVYMLEGINDVHLDSPYMVRFLEWFEYKQWVCLVFEKLDRSLYDHIKNRGWMSMTLHLIRPIAKQLFLALAALSLSDILHTDIKPDNIMFVSMLNQCQRVKLIDLGNALPASYIQPGMHLQAIGYRAPEIILGLPFTKAIDVWGVGCVLAFLYLGDNLFCVDSEYEMVKGMVELLGQPEDHLLHRGIYTKNFFIQEQATDQPRWRLMTLEEYLELGGHSGSNSSTPEQQNSSIGLLSSLDDLIHIYAGNLDAEIEDRRVFVDLMKQLLDNDCTQRISAHQALQHPFITMDHLVKDFDSCHYVNISQRIMNSSSREAKGPAVFPSHHGSSDDNDPEVCSSDGEIRTISAPWHHREELLSASDEDDSDGGYSDGEVPSIFSARPSQGDSSMVSNGNDPELLNSYGGQHQRYGDGDLMVSSSEAAQETNFAPAVLSLSDHHGKWLRKINRFLSQVRTSFCHCKHNIVCMVLKK